MNNDFWISRWTNDQTGWHMNEVHPKLKQYWPRLELDENAVVLVPFCGQSVDLLWLKKRYGTVIGVELVEKPVKTFMQNHFDHYQKREADAFTIYEAENLQLWQGDYFNLNRSQLPAIDGIYDRGSLVALPPGQRKKYARKIRELSALNTHMLLVAFDYKQEEMNGPPFSVPYREVQKHYEADFQIKQLHNESILEEVDGFRQQGLSSYMDLNVYHLIHR